ncbi:MAG: CBS domain-containing protein [Caldilineales bacterium]
MTRNVPVVSVDASLSDVVNLLVTTSQRRVVVVDAADQLAGIITDGDLLQRSSDDDRSGILAAFSQRLPLAGRDQIRLGRRTAADVMARNPIAVLPETPLLEALQRLLQAKIKRLPVVDDAGHVVGLIGRGQILQALAGDV